MSKIVEQIADKGDAAITRWSEEHLPQSELAKARRKRVARVTGAITMSLVVAGGVTYFAETLVNTADHQAQHVQEQNKEWAQEAENTQRQLDNGQLTITVPESKASNDILFYDPTSSPTEIPSPETH